jgi:Protein of unknown function (DUF3089)
MDRMVALATSALVASVLVLSVGSAAVLGASAPHWRSWLCLPGGANDWCAVVLKTATISASGSVQIADAHLPSAPPVDCFYVYPTISNQKRGNSTLTVEPVERDIAIVQAAEFSRVCRVFAPMYQQVTQYGNGNPYHGNYALEYRDVLAAWRDYLAHYNHGRGVVLIGHSEGAFILKELIQKQIEGTPEQKLLVSAILLGGDVVVKDGSTEGGDFSSVAACTSASETGCVVAYSSWSRTPPSDASLQDVAKPGSEHVLCVNPAAPGSSGAAPITPIFPGRFSVGIFPLQSTAYFAYPFVAFPNLYTARCVRQGSRAWLLITRIHHPGDHRPTVQDVLAPNRGLHAADVNIALGNLVNLVGSQSRAWLKVR